MPRRRRLRRFLVTTVALAIARVVCLAAGRDPRKPLAAGLVLLSAALTGCTGTIFEFRQHVGYIDPNTGCPRWAHNVRGPDDYDVAHGRPYHCEVPQTDQDYVDIDQVDP